MRRVAVLDADPRPRPVGTPPRLESAEAVTKRVREAHTADTAARRAHGMAEAARLTVTRSRREAVPLSDVTESRPEALLSVLRDGRPDGALLSVGTVAVLAGAGGVAKSTLVAAAAPALRALQCRYRIVSGFRGSVGLAYGVASCIGSVIPALRAGG